MLNLSNYQDQGSPICCFCSHHLDQVRLFRTFLVHNWLIVLGLERITPAIHSRRALSRPQSCTTHDALWLAVKAQRDIIGLTNRHQRACYLLRTF
jgi:hypothetical protein